MAWRTKVSEFVRLFRSVSEEDMAEFTLWLDMRVAEIKVTGAIQQFESDGEIQLPNWIRSLIQIQLRKLWSVLSEEKDQNRDMMGLQKQQISLDMDSRKRLADDMIPGMVGDKCPRISVMDQMSIDNSWLMKTDSTSSVFPPVFKRELISHDSSFPSVPHAFAPPSSIAQPIRSSANWSNRFSQGTPGGENYSQLNTRGGRHSEPPRPCAAIQCADCSSVMEIKGAKPADLEKDGQDKSYTCHQCQRKFVTSNSLRVHVKAEHGSVVPRYRCRMCGKVSKHKGNLKAHITGVHKLPEVVDAIELIHQSNSDTQSMVSHPGSNLSVLNIDMN